MAVVEESTDPLESLNVEELKRLVPTECVLSPFLAHCDTYS